MSIRFMLTWRHVAESSCVLFAARATSVARALLGGVAFVARGVHDSVAALRRALLRAVAPTLELHAGAAAREYPPFSLEALLNGRNLSIPLATGAPHWRSELQDASRIAGLARGIDARLEVTTVSLARILLADCSDPMRAHQRIAAAAADLLQLGMDAVAYQSVPVGCIPSMQIRERGVGGVEALLYASDTSKEGQSVLAEVVRGMARPLERLAECKVPPGIQLSDAHVTRVCVSCEVPLTTLHPGLGWLPELGQGTLVLPSGRELATLARFSADSHDPEHASRHNSRVLQALCEVTTAWRIESWRLTVCAQRHASRWGSCEPLVRWHRHADRLYGELVLPIDVDALTHGLVEDSSTAAAPQRELAAELALQAGCVGLLASLAFLRSALATTRP